MCAFSNIAFTEDSLQCIERRYKKWGEILYTYFVKCILKNKHMSEELWLNFIERNMGILSAININVLCMSFMPCKYLYQFLIRKKLHTLILIFLKLSE